jgi:hypothetical protein
MWALVCVLACAFLVFPAAAQTIDLEWSRWDSTLTITDDTTMTVSETQAIDVFSGTVRRGTRDWDQAVTVARVFIIDETETPVVLQQRASGEAPGTYVLGSSSEGGTRLTYFLPAPVSAGTGFTVQINYTAELPSAGIADWALVPQNRGFVVQSSTSQIVFPQGQVPAESFIRITEGAGDVAVQGNTAAVVATRPIAANTAFRVQAPFGTGVGAAGNSSGAAAQPAAQPATSIPRTVAPASSGVQNASGGFDLGACLPILLILLILFIGGGRGLGGLLGGMGRMGGGGAAPRGGGFGGFPGLGGFGGSGRSSGSRPSAPSGGGGGGGRGFRQSGRSGRLPSFRSGKGGGGGASFG